jgi:hypothetical protein
VDVEGDEANVRLHAALHSMKESVAGGARPVQWDKDPADP